MPFESSFEYKPGYILPGTTNQWVGGESKLTYWHVAFRLTRCKGRGVDMFWRVAPVLCGARVDGWFGDESSLRHEKQHAAVFEDNWRSLGVALMYYTSTCYRLKVARCLKPALEKVVDAWRDKAKADNWEFECNDYLQRLVDRRIVARVCSNASTSRRNADRAMHDAYEAIRLCHG